MSSTAMAMPAALPRGLPSHAQRAPCQHDDRIPPVAAHGLPRRPARVRARGGGAGVQAAGHADHGRAGGGDHRAAALVAGHAARPGGGPPPAGGAGRPARGAGGDRRADRADRPRVQPRDQPVRQLAAHRRRRPAPPAGRADRHLAHPRGQADPELHQRLHPSSGQAAGAGGDDRRQRGGGGGGADRGPADRRLHRDAPRAAVYGAGAVGAAAAAGQGRGGAPPPARRLPGWLRGLAIGMVVLGGLTYLGLELVGLQFAAFFAVFTAIAMIVPYFGALASSIVPILYALTFSPEKA